MARRTSAARSMPVGTGARDTYVTIQQLVETVGSSNFPVETWITLVDMFARKEQLGGREQFGNGQLSAPFDTRWEVDYRPDMDPDLVDVPKKRRLVYQGRTYDIVDAAMIGRLDGVELLTLARHG